MKELRSKAARHDGTGFLRIEGLLGFHYSVVQEFFENDFLGNIEQVLHWKWNHAMRGDMQPEEIKKRRRQGLRNYYRKHSIDQKVNDDDSLFSYASENEEGMY